MKSRHLSSTAVTPLLLTVFLGIVSAGIGYAAQTSVRIVSQVFLVDSKGKILGNSPGNSPNSPTTPDGEFGPWLIEIDQRLVAISVRPNGYLNGELFYELPDCEGQPWIHQPQPSRGWTVRYGIAAPGNTLYLPSDTIAPRTIVTRSGHFTGGCVEVTGTTLAAPAEPVVDLDTVFTPPFSIRVMPLRGNGILPPGR